MVIPLPFNLRCDFKDGIHSQAHGLREATQWSLTCTIFNFSLVAAGLRYSGDR
jgi:hypothetical protein